MGIRQSGHISQNLLQHFLVQGYSEVVGFKMQLKIGTFTKVGNLVF